VDERFRELAESLAPKFERLLAQVPVKYQALPRNLPQRGIYLFSEGPAHLYVGRSNNLRQRLRDHCSLSGDHFTATFAFLLARHQTGQIRATYKPVNSRAALLQQPAFREAFEHTKRRIAQMDIRYVEEDDPIRQALLEIHVAVVLRTPYNDFSTH